MNTWHKTVLLLATIPALAFGGDDRPDAYAYGWDLEAVPMEAGGFRSVALSRDVRAVATSPSLADVAVFDDDDRRMPAFLIEPQVELAPDPAPVALPLFRTVETLAASAASARVAVQTTGGATVDAEVRIDADQSGGSLARWYSMLSDAQVATRWTEALAQWAESGEPQVVSLRVEVSDDLHEWHPVAQGAVAEFRSGAATLKHDRIEVALPLARFLRITALDVPADWQLTGFALIPPRTAVEAAREWHEQVLPPGTATVDIDLGGALRIDRFELALQPGAGLRRARLSSAESPTGPWLERADASFYSVNSGQNALFSLPLAISPTLGRYWRVDVVGEGVASSTVRLGWATTELVFLAQGRAPYQLVAGRGTRVPDLTLDAETRALWHPGDGRTITVALGARHDLAGERARSPDFAADWKRWVLWALMALGVGAVLAMAGQLLRELKR